MSNTIEKVMEISAPVSKVWLALTDYEQFGLWFKVKLDQPFSAGKPSTGHMTYPGYEHIRWTAQVHTIEPETYFSYTWHPYAVDPKVDYSGELPTLVEFQLEATPTGALLIVTESGFENLPPSRYSDALRMNTRGWEQQLKHLEAYVHKTA